MIILSNFIVSKFHITQNDLMKILHREIYVKIYRIVTSVCTRNTKNHLAFELFP
jgi:hypothetical protein